MPQLLIELFSEDIPARMQARAAEDLQRLVTTKLAAAGLEAGVAAAHSTPRRLALVIDGLAERTADVREERKGPRVGSPEQAVAGFLRGAGLSSLEQCEQRDTGKGAFWFAVVEKPGRATAEVLPGIIVETIRELPWPKSMRWATSDFRWVRPLHHILAVFDGKPVEGSFDLGGGLGVLTFVDTTRGHRFLSPDAIVQATSFDQYRDGLRAAHVMLSRDERRAKIETDASEVAGGHGLVVAPDDGLLDEVTGLVEWPVVLSGAIDQQFMDVPPEVLTTSMRTHQKYFATTDATGALAPRFVVVANMATSDGGAAVIAGNERVLRARLSDAKFFWEQDRKVKLEERVPALESVIFHARLGTVAEKVNRLETLAAELAAFVPGADPDQARLAARLAKADLVSGMVGEFPELQGVMGRYYALGEGLPAPVADAIAEHYKPLGPNDRCPTAPVSVAVALADKLDTLVGFFAIDERPTGSKDPYALRRAALGLIRLIVDNGLRLELGRVFELAHGLYRAEKLVPATQTGPQLLEFFADRLKVVLRDRGVRHDLVDAVFALGGEDDLVRLLSRVQALQGFLGTDDGANLLTAYRRATNIVRIEEKKDGRTHGEAPEAGLLELPEEKALFQALADAERAAVPLLASEDFGGCMGALAALRPPVDAFFDRVTVNADQPPLRVNRLRLLSQIPATLNRIADFSKIEG
ncbi:glycyl-tRNA synthetase subunit beta [Skermanella stibiiresistens SB22]|uniref:Glycine--tRNA ligase beta subunit n=1 Tax=Skermanella stibiiresistens SB22 TaxID=1385369 RepID=W9H4Z8_9PROT|nr:glycine--tRNA ligase subunit beta [Skermanella stibiiresistens]EWY41305.1 glycyl-tRNA synthetase subunit beta [Skermanella stibiiresistens SB22]